MRIAFAFLILSTLWLLGESYPTARRPLYNNLWGTNIVGVPGGIPTGQTVYTNVPAGMGTTDLEAVRSNCPSNQVVVLSNGVYTISGGGDAALDLTKNGVVFRGQTNAAGMPTTIFNAGNVWIGSKDAWPSIDWTDLTAINISSGLTLGSTSITLASAPGADFVLGSLMLIDQTDDGTLVANTTQGLGRRPGRNYNLIVQITNISGSTVGFQPPLAGVYWSSGLTPQACAWESSRGATWKYIGLENVIVSNTPGLYNTGIAMAYGCWFKNVWISDWGTTPGSAGLEMRQVLNCSVVDGMFYDGPSAVSSSYALNPYGVYFSAIENNIFTNLPLAIATANAVACSFTYNVAFGPNNYATAGWNPEYFFTHGGHCHTDLWEGNWLPSPLTFDDVDSNNGSLHGIIRNRLVGWVQSDRTSDNYAYRFWGTHRTNTALGNILGMEGYHTIYVFAGSDPAIIRMDAASTGLIRTNNYNVSDDAIPTGESMAGDTMRDSYRYDSAPAWWGNLQWPPFPVTSVSTNALYYTNIPAGFRSYFGQWPAGTPETGGGAVGRPKIRGIRLRR